MGIAKERQATLKATEGEIVTSDIVYAGPESSMEVGDFVLEACGLKTKGMPTIEEFATMIRWLIWVSRNQPWWIGDAIVWGESRFGDAIYDAIDMDPHAVDQMIRCAGVARGMPPATRNKSLWFTHHREVCGLPKEVAAQKLAEAEEQVLSSAELRKRVKKKSVRKKRKPKW